MSHKSIKGIHKRIFYIIFPYLIDEALACLWPMARTSPLDGHSLLFLLLLTDEGSSAFPAYHIPAWSDIETTFFPFPICASIRHYSPKLVQKNAWTGQPVRLPAAYRHHRNSTSSGFSGGRPHCVVPGQGGCDWTEVSLSAVRGHGNSTLLMIDWESGVYRSCLKMYCTSMDRTMSCRQSSRTPHVAFVPHDRTANVTDWLDMKLSMYGGQVYSHPF